MPADEFGSKHVGVDIDRSIHYYNGTAATYYRCENSRHSATHGGRRRSGQRRRLS